MTLDISPLEGAVFQLQKSFNYLHSEMAEDEGLREQFQAATIKAFEFTYELAIKTIKRQLSVIVPNTDELAGMSFADQMREAAIAGLIHDPDRYIEYRRLRNISSHTYDCNQAENIALAVEEFLKDVRFLLEKLIERNS